jgi:hypothetical protein
MAKSSRYVEKHSCYISGGWDPVTGEDVYTVRCSEHRDLFIDCGTDYAKAKALEREHDGLPPRAHPLPNSVFQPPRHD